MMKSYAKISCLSLKPNAAVFCLKRNLKNLATDIYSENLIAYLNNAYCCKTTVEDLKNVMHGIMNWSIDLTNKNQSNNSIPGRRLPDQY